MTRARPLAGSLLLVAAFSISACTAAAPSAGGSGAATASPASANPSTAKVMPTVDPLKSDFHLYVDKPIVANGPDGTWYAQYAAPNASLYYDGKFYVFHDGTLVWPGMLPEGVAWSTDGMNFSRPTPDEPVLTPKHITDAGLALPGNMEAATVLVDSGTWVMYFTATTSIDNWIGSIGRATAPSATGPWTVDRQYVMTPNVAGNWDQSGSGFPSVVHSGDNWYMWYSGGSYVGLAKSKDGSTWTRYDDPVTKDAVFAHGDPVLQDDGSGAYAPFSGQDPRVVRVGDGWMMTYADATSDESYSTSADGIHWTAGIKIVNASQLGLTLWWSTLMVHDGTAYLYFEAGKMTTGGSDGYLATWKV